MWQKSVVSKQRLFPAIQFLTLLILCSASAADFHKWVDESGQVHYGDCPPNDCASQSVEIANPPSQEEVERAHQRLERYQEIIRQHRASRLAAPIESPHPPVKLTPERIPCFDPIDTIVVGPSSPLYEPIVPTILSKQQQRYLSKIFDKLDTDWRKGKVNITICKESADTVSESNGEDDDARVEVNSITAENRLQIKIEWYDEIQNKKDRRILNFEIGDRLYFTGNTYFQKIKLPGNSVEVIDLDNRSLLFLIKPRIRAAKGRIPIPEIRYLVVSDKKWSLTELRYAQNRLIERRDWVFGKSSNR